MHYEGNTIFYHEVRQSGIGIAALFAGVLKRHPKGSAGEVFIGGTAATTPDTAHMLDRWQRPWLFSRFLLAGVLFCSLSMVLYQVFCHPSGWILLDSIGAMVLPLGVLLFFWELNIPRNIPLYTILGVFMIGGILSIIITLLESFLLPDMPAYMAPLTEEPAKLLVATLFVALLKAEYGLNGLLIGAAVGAGFACFENIYYIFMKGFYETFIQTADYQYAVEESVNIFLLRNLGTLGGGHIFWAAAEAGALVLDKGQEELGFRHLQGRTLRKYMAAAMGIHALWNSGFLMYPLWGRNGTPVLYMSTLLCTFLSVALVLRLLQPCLRQVLQAADGTSWGNGVLRLYCLRGSQKGWCWESRGEPLVLGREEEVAVRLSGEEKGVSRRHCSIQKTAQGWTVKDLNSSYGTYTSAGKLSPGAMHRVADGDVFYLGSREVAFQVVLLNETDGA